MEKAQDFDQFPNNCDGDTVLSDMRHRSGAFYRSLGQVLLDFL